MLSSADTKVRGRISEMRGGPSRPCARNASAALQNFVCFPRKDFFDSIDPNRTFLMSSYRVLRWKQSRKGEFAMRRAVLICAVLAVLSPTCAEAAERVWRLGLLTLPGTAS